MLCKILNIFSFFIALILILSNNLRLDRVKWIEKLNIVVPVANLHKGKGLSGQAITLPAYKRKFLIKEPPISLGVPTNDNRRRPTQEQGI